MCIFNLLLGHADAAGPGTPPWDPPSYIPKFSLFFSKQPGALQEEKRPCSNGCVPPVGCPKGRCPSRPPATETSWAHPSLSSDLPLSGLVATPKLPSPPMHVAFCLLLFSHSRVASHPSVSARFSHPGFIWHLALVLIHLTVQIFTFLKPSVFL